MSLTKFYNLWIIFRISFENLIHMIIPPIVIAIIGLFSLYLENLYNDEILFQSNQIFQIFAKISGRTISFIYLLLYITHNEYAFSVLPIFLQRSIIYITLIGGINFKSIQIIHYILYKCILLFSIIHILFHTFNGYLYFYYLDRGYNELRIIITGIILLLLLAVNNNSYINRLNYRYYYVIHIFFNFFIYICNLIHISTYVQIILNSLSPLILVIIHFYNIIKTKRNIDYKCKKINNNKLKSNIIELTIVCNDKGVNRINNIVYVNIPKISNCEWHPFLCTFHNKLYISVVGKWTRALLRNINVKTKMKINILQCTTITNYTNIINVLIAKACCFIVSGEGINVFFNILLNVCYRNNLNKIIIIIITSKVEVLLMLDNFIRNWQKNTNTFILTTLDISFEIFYNGIEKDIYMCGGLIPIRYHNISRKDLLDVADCKYCVILTNSMIYDKIKKLIISVNKNIIFY